MRFAELLTPLAMNALRSALIQGRAVHTTFLSLSLSLPVSLSSLQSLFLNLSFSLSLFLQSLFSAGMSLPEEMEVPDYPQTGDGCGLP